MNCETISKTMPSRSFVRITRFMSLCSYRIKHLSILIHSSHGRGAKKKNTPPHCTQVTKDTDYLSKFKYDYPIAYILPGQHEAYQKMYCINPPAVNKAVTVVCDWAAPPQVQFTLGDDYMHVVRQDPTGRFLGNAVITTYQLCNHNMGSHLANDTFDLIPVVTEIL